MWFNLSPEETAILTQRETVIGSVITEGPDCGAHRSQERKKFLVPDDPVRLH